MNLTEMVSLIGTYVDDVVDIPTGTSWLNQGLNKMAVAVGAKFPQLSSTDTMSTFVFDEKWHDIPVLYASAIYKGKDTSLQEKNSFMSQFMEELKQFTVKYDLEPWFRDDAQSQQFVAVVGQTDFLITKISYDNATGDLKVYKYDPVLKYATKLIENADFTVNMDTTKNDFTLTTACVGGETVTAVWEIHADIQEPPYSFWGW